MERHLISSRQAAKYREYGQKVLRHVTDVLSDGGWDIDGEVLVDMAVDCGLLEYVPFDPDKHGGISCAEELVPFEHKIYWLRSE